MIDLILPWPPSLNHYKEIGALITTKKGKTYQTRYNSPLTKLFYYEVWVKLRDIRLKERMPMPLDSTISLQATIHLHPPSKRRYDVDNYTKVLLDSLVRGGLLQDDSQITKLIVEKKEMVKNGKVILTLSKI